MSAKEEPLVQSRRIVVVGGGAAGFFAAITAAERGHDVTILEASPNVLAKVKISGGGRCNLTHHCFDPRELVKNYPRGGKQLRGPFAKFQPSDTIEWFARRGVETKVEADGRMFPTSDDSQTIVDCLLRSAADAGVEVETRTNVTAISCLPESDDANFRLETQSGKQWLADALLIATGGSKSAFEFVRGLGHEIVSPVPSLFTFNISDARIKDLPGVAVENVSCQLAVGSKRFQQSGPLLITHWGFSGPAILKLSSWAARELFEAKYQARLRVSWLSDLKLDVALETINSYKTEYAKREVGSVCPWPLPKRLWRSFVDHCGATETRWAELSKKCAQKLAHELTIGDFSVSGKGVFKEEFVTCGGVQLKQVDFRTMESRVVPDLYFAGEVLDVDALTGGFNFQNAWTTAWISGNAM